MMRSLPRDLADYTFVDIGAGKSRTLLLASRYSFAKIVGVEFAKELVACAAAQHRELQIRTAKMPRSRDCRGRCDAIPIPGCAAGAVFLQSVFARTSSTWCSTISLRRSKRTNEIATSSMAVHRTTRSAGPSPPFSPPAVSRKCRPRPMPLFFDAVRTVNYAVFRAEVAGPSERTTIYQRPAIYSSMHAADALA